MDNKAPSSEGAFLVCPHPRDGMGVGYLWGIWPIAPFFKFPRISKPKSYFQLFKFSRNPGSCWEFVPEEKEKVDKRKRIYITYLILN